MASRLGCGLVLSWCEAGSPDRDAGDWQAGRWPLAGTRPPPPAPATAGPGRGPDGRQRWREDAIGALLATEDADVLFVVGCEENQVQFHAQSGHIILLSAPAQTLAQRLAGRTGNSYGKAPGELGRIRHDIKMAEPLLRQVADHDIQTTMPLSDVVTAILRLISA